MDHAACDTAPFPLLLELRHGPKRLTDRDAKANPPLAALQLAR